MNDETIEYNLQTMQLPLNQYVNEMILRHKYHELAKKYHPDLFPQIDAKIFQSIHDAYLELLQNIKEVNRFIDYRIREANNTLSENEKMHRKLKAKLLRQHRTIQTIVFTFVIFIIVLIILDIVCAIIYALTLERLYLNIVLIGFIVFAPLIISVFIMNYIDHRH